MSKTVKITCLLNPVTQEKVECYIPATGKLSDHITIPESVQIERNGYHYRDEKLFEGDIVNLSVPPMGGDSGKDAARTAIILASQVAAGVLTSGMSYAASAAITAAVSLGVTIGVNALIPPPQNTAQLGDNTQFTRLGTLTGTRNRLNPYGVVPRIYGKRKTFPVLSARPYTEIINNQQFLNLLFMVTKGPCELSDPRIGNTIIGSFDANNVFTPNNNFSEVQIDVGESPGLYSNIVNENSIGVQFENADDVAIRTTEPDTERITFDFLFPQGLFAITENGNTREARVEFKIEIRETGTTTWYDIESNNIPGFSVFGQLFSNFQYMGFGTFAANSKSRNTLRTGFSTEVDKGQYDLRVTRITGKGEGVNEDYPQVFDSATWTVLRSMTYEKPTQIPGAVQIAMRIKATDQLSGVIDDFSVVAESRLAFYDGSSWNIPTFNPETGNGTGGGMTDNPAWIMADILTGDSASRPIDKNRLVADSFKSWADNNDLEGRGCNLVVDRSQTVHQLALLVGSTGRGSLRQEVNGRFEIIQDLEQTTPVQHFTERNSFDFNSVRNFPDIPHALRVNFVNPAAGYQTDEVVVYDDGYSADGTDCHFADGTGVCKVATVFETIDLEGVTSYEQAWKEGRYRLAETQLRPERYTLKTDVESIVCQRGDMVVVSHQIPLFGLSSGRIKAISGTTLTLDEQVVMESGKNYTIRVRTSSGTSTVKSVTTSVGTTNEVEVNNTTGIQTGDLYSFGESGKETVKLKVLNIEPLNDLKHRLELVDHAPEIYDADQGAIPDFDSNVTTPGDPGDPEILNQKPPEPTITNVRSEGDSLNLSSDGVPEIRIVLSYALGSGAPTEIVEGRFRKQEDEEDAYTSFGSVTGSMGLIQLNDVELGETYILQIRGRTGSKVSEWVESVPHVAGVDVILPPDRFAIGETLADYEFATVTQVLVRLDEFVTADEEYWIVNRYELSLTDRSAGIYPIVPNGFGEFKARYGPSATINLPIDEQTINAPKGSLIYKAPGQVDTNIAFPDFSFIDDTLEVAFDTLRSSMDLIAQGVNFAKPNTNAVDVITGDVLLSGVTGDLDDIEDGTSFKRVASIAISPNGIVLMEQIEGTIDEISNGTEFGKVHNSAINLSGVPLLGAAFGDIDDIEDGTNYGRINALAISSGNILMTSVIGDLDDIEDGTGHAKVLATSISSGKILLSEATGDLDDLADGTSFQKVASTQLTPGGIVLLSVVSGSLGDVDDDSNFAKVNAINVDATTGRISLVEAIGNLDDIEDGEFSKVRGTNVTTSGLVTVSGLSGDYDDLEDGDDFAKLMRNGAAGVQVDNAGFIRIFGPNGQVVIKEGQIFADEIFTTEVTVSDRITMLYQNTTGIPTSSSLVFRNVEGGTVRGALTYGNVLHKLSPSVGSGSFAPAGIKLFSTNRPVSLDAGNSGIGQVRGNLVRLDAVGNDGHVQIYLGNNDSMTQILEISESAGILNATESGRIRLDIDSGNNIHTRYIQLYS